MKVSESVDGKIVFYQIPPRSISPIIETDSCRAATSSSIAWFIGGKSPIRPPQAASGTFDHPHQYVLATSGAAAAALSDKSSRHSPANPVSDKFWPPAHWATA